MAIARVTSASNTTTGSTTITTSYTIAAGSNRLLVAGGELQTGAPFTAFSYNGSSGTIDISKTDTAGSNTACVASKIAPDVGTFNSVLTKTGSSDGLYIGLMDYTGVKQTSQPDATASANTASNSTLSYSITTVANNCWIMTCAGGTQANLTGTVNFTVQQTPTGGIKVGDSNGSVGTAGSKTVTMTMTSGRIWSASASYAPSLSATMTETLTLTDTLKKLTTKPFAETLTLTDVLSAIKVRFKTLSETISLTDTLTRITKLVLKETLTLTDTIKKMAKKTQEETIVLTDAFSRIQKKVFTETISLVDTLSKYLDGLFVTLWKKVAKPSGDSWDKIDKPSV